jgi:hypothetical protein
VSRTEEPCVFSIAYDTHAIPIAVWIVETRRGRLAAPSRQHQEHVNAATSPAVAVWSEATRKKTKTPPSSGGVDLLAELTY